MIRTFLDAGVLIAAFRSRNAASTPALTLLDDPERVFVTTDYVRLEVLPKPLYFRRETETEFYEAFFAAAELVDVSQALVSAAFEEARQAGLAAMDALHIAAAKRASVDEFITVERLTRPVFRAAAEAGTTYESGAAGEPVNSAARRAGLTAPNPVRDSSGTHLRPIR